MAGLKVFLLQKYGINGYDEMLIYRQVTAWFFGLLIMGVFFYIHVPIQKYWNKQELSKQEDKDDLGTTYNGAF